MDVDFSVASRGDWRDWILAHDRTRPFAYIVTPNVDHVVRLSREAELGPLYDGAAARICDSRVLSKLARTRGHALKVYPGSDIVHDLLEDPRARGCRIGICGPSRADFATLQARYPDHDLAWIDAPFMKVGDANWQRVLGDIEAAQADLLLLCISFPKQEFMAHALKERGTAVGMGLCVGASLDFLTGQQRRAPKLVQRLSLEWLHRLLGDPRRLWRRYLVDGPKIFGLYLRREVFGPGSDR